MKNFDKIFLIIWSISIFMIVLMMIFTEEIIYDKEPAKNITLRMNISQHYFINNTHYSYNGIIKDRLAMSLAKDSARNIFYPVDSKKIQLYNNILEIIDVQEDHIIIKYEKPAVKGMKIILKP